MEKLYAVARLLAVIVAIVAAFVTIPYVATILLVLGAISAVGNTPEDNTRLFLITAVLLIGSKELAALPDVGTYLATIFGGIGTAAFGASAVAVMLGLYRLSMGALAPKAAA